MSNKEIFESRDRVHLKIIENLSRYGNLEAANHFGRAYNEGTLYKNQFTAANYLRIAAAQSQKTKDPRWMSENAIKENGFTLLKNAAPVEIEYWENVQGESRYVGHLQKFYNAADIKEFEEPLTIQGNQANDFQYAVDLLHDVAGISLNEERDANVIFNAVKEYVSTKGADDIAANLTAQMFLKTAHIGYDYEKNPLFTKEQIEGLSKEPKQLFIAMVKANQVFKEMERIQREHIHQRKVKQEEPFKDLSVVFHWSERKLKDLDGMPYQEETYLQGEKAYQFLVQLNAVDKQNHREMLLGQGGYDNCLRENRAILESLKKINPVHLRGNFENMEFCYNEIPFCSVQYEMGTGKLNEMVPKGFPQHPDLEVNKKLQEAVYTWAKYTNGDYDNKGYQLYHQNEVYKLDMDKIRSDYKGCRRLAPSANHKRYLDFYETLSFLDFRNDTPGKVNEAMVREMVKDGIGEKKILNIVKANPRWDMTAETKELLQSPEIKSEIKAIKKSASMER